MSDGPRYRPTHDEDGEEIEYSFGERRIEPSDFELCVILVTEHMPPERHHPYNEGLEGPHSEIYAEVWAASYLHRAMAMHHLMKRDERMAARADEIRDLLPLDRGEFDFLEQLCEQQGLETTRAPNFYIIDMPGIRERWVTWLTADLDGYGPQVGRAKAFVALCAWALEMAWTEPEVPSDSPD